MPDCHENGRIMATRPDLTGMIFAPSRRRLSFHCRVTPGFSCGTCESQYILSYSNRSDFLAPIAVPYRISEILYDFLWNYVFKLVKYKI
jgi:hypothetical protein